MKALPDPAATAPVGPAEAGQKIIRFLQRRLGLPTPLLHRWLRTGQIRLNGRRCKPFDIVAEGDMARLPPFAKTLAACGNLPDPPTEGSGLPRLLAAADGIWAFAKPAGLATQPGAGGDDSFSAMLARYYANYYFKPAPAHRLDKETSGILLVGASAKAMRELQGWFRAGRARKEYLAWVGGRWPFNQEKLLRHYVGGLDHIEAREKPFANGREALCAVRPLEISPEKSLLQIRLITGRKRQIRAQLAACGFPVIGDSRYGFRNVPGLKLHAFRTILPNGQEFICEPPWEDEFHVGQLPRAM